MKQTMRTLTVACAVAFAGSAWAADDITRCGSAQLKAYGGIFNGIYKEAARACGTEEGSDAATVEARVNPDKTESITSKFNKAIASTEEKYGDANCFIDDSAGATLDPADILAQTQDTASDLCSSDGSNP